MNSPLIKKDEAKPSANQPTSNPPQDVKPIIPDDKKIADASKKKPADANVLMSNKPLPETVAAENKAKPKFPMGNGDNKLLVGPPDNQYKRIPLLRPFQISVVANIIFGAGMVFFIMTRVTVIDNSPPMQCSVSSTPVSAPDCVPVKKTHNTSNNNFSGKYITAAVPAGWEVKEYTDNSGMKDPGSDSYSGFTGMDVTDVLKYGKLLTLRGLSGITDSPCIKVYQFQDTDTAFLVDMAKAGKAVDERDFKVIDLSIAAYHEDTLLDTRIRRVDAQLYINQSDDDSFFNPRCGTNQNIIDIKTIGFTKNGQTYKTGSDSYYEIQIVPGNPAEIEMLTLDDVINSVAPKQQ